MDNHQEEELMIYLHEILSQKNLINQKIKELRKILSYDQSDKYAEALVDLIDQRNSKLIKIHIANTASKINIGGTDVDITTAVILLGALEEKIDSLTELIDSENCSLDKLKLMAQRDRYFEEHTLINMGVLKNDLNVTLE